MRNILQTILIIIIFSSCSFEEPLKFEKINNLKLTGLEDDMIQLTAEAYFYNPNEVSGKLKNISLDVSLNGNILAHISELEKQKIGKNTSFSVPFKASIAMKDLQKGFLNNLLNIISGKKVKLHFKGEIKVSTWGFTQTVPVDYFEGVKL